MNKKAALFVTLFLLFSINLFADGEALIPRRLFLFFESGEELNQREQIILEESLVANLAARTEVIIVEGAESKLLPQSVEERGAIASEYKADCWLLVKVQPQDNQLDIAARLFDISAENLLWEKSFNGTKRLQELESTLWQELVGAVEEALPPRAQEFVVEEIIRKVTEVQLVEKIVGIPLTIEALPGTRISGLTKEQIIIPAEGRATLEVPGGATYQIRAAKKSYYPEELGFFVDKEALTVDVEQKQSARFGAELLMNIDNFTGLGLYYFPLRGFFFTGLRGEASFFSVFPPFDVYEWDWDSRNILLSLDLGCYLFPADSFFRLALSAGAFMRLYFPPDGTAELHPYFPYGVNLGTLFEFSRSRKIRFFLENRIKISLRQWDQPATGTNGDGPYRGILMLSDIFGDVTFIRDLLIKLGEFRLGWRVQL